MNTDSTTFRLLLSRTPALEARFQCNRGGFRQHLANALIELRLQDQQSPVVLQVSCPSITGVKPKPSPAGWVGLPVGVFPGGRLPAVIRWESAGDLCDQLLRAREEHLAAFAPVRPSEPAFRG